MKRVAPTLATILALVTFARSGCAGAKSEQVPTITGNNNTITINQAPNIDKASETKVDAAGSGYGSVTR